MIPKCAKRRLARKSEVRNAAAVLSPLKTPRNAAIEFSSGNWAVMDREKGRKIEK